MIGDRDALELNVKERIKEYQEANINYNESEGNYYYKVERREIGDQVEFTQHLKDYIRDYIKYSLLNLDEGSQNRLVNIPRHLDDFMREHSGQLAESIIMANNYRLGTHYKISNPEGKQEKITPVDYLNTGVVQLSLTWSDGLHQYIELKHGLNIRTESLTNIFRSYVGYFLKYEGSIYGLTGTLGEEEHHKYLSDVYKVDSKLMPNYVKKNLERFKPIIVGNRVDWEEEVSNQAIRKGEYSKRGFLIICKTINEVNRIYEVIKSEKAYKGRVMRYSDSGHFDESIIQRIISGEMKVAAGDIIVATNLAGRGTDLKIERAVNKNGGLHVILSYYPDSIRVEAQAFGRGARNGDYGSAGLIIEYADKDVDIDYLGKERDIRESKRLEDSKSDTISQMKSQDELFDRFVDLVAKVNSPTGFELVRGNPYSKENGKIYVYREHTAKDSLIHIKCYKPESTSYLANLESSEVSKYIKNISEKSYNHLIDTLSNSLRSFNQRDNELVHYFASEMGCIENNMEIKGRVDRRYCSTIEGDNEFEILYDKYCGGTHKSNASRDQVSKEGMEELELIRHKERFEIWERDRELYNHKYEIEQLKKNWAIWLKDAGTFGPKGLFGWEGSDKKEQIEKLNKEFKVFADEQLILFKNDLSYSNKDRYVVNNCEVRESKEYKEDELLMKNPSYLVQKSRNYIAQHYNREIQEDYKYKKNHVRVCNHEKDSDILSIILGGIPPQRSINYATDFAERGIELDYKFAWSGYNMLAITKLIRDGEWITDYEDAEAAARVKQEFYTDLATTRNSLESYIIPKQSHECGALIISRVAERNADTVKQCLFILKSYEKISRHLEVLMDTVAKAAGDEMIRPSRMYGAEEILNRIDSKDLEESFEMVVESIEAKQEKEKLEKEYNEGKITNEVYEERLGEIRSQTLGEIGITNQDNLFNKVSKMQFRAMTEDLSHDLNLLGFLGYDIEVYELDKDWTDTIIAGILSIATLAIGIVMLPAGGFLGVIGTSLIAQSVLELVQIGISIDKGIPINLDQFIKSKGIGVAVAIITAGIAKGLESSGIVAAESIPGFQGLEKGANAIQKAAFIKTGVFNALKMSAVMGAVDATSRYVANEYMKKNDGSIEEDIKEAIEAVLLSHSEEITKILLNDEFNNKFKGRASEQEIKKVVDEALKIITNYASQGTARQLVSGVAGKVSSFFGAIPGAIANLADAAVGYTKASEAVDELKERLEGKISKIASKAKATKELMEEKLMQDFPKDAEFIMAEINGAGLLINGGINIDYDHCERYNEVGEKSGKDVTGECEYIAGLREEAKKDKEKLKNRLVEASLGPIRGIYTREVAMPIVRGELVDPIVGGGLRKSIQYLEENIGTTIKKPVNIIPEDLREDEDSGWGLLGTLAKKVLKSIEANKARVNFENYRNERLRQEIEGTIQRGQVQYEYTEGESTKAEEKWNKVLVKKGHTVWGIYSNNPTQKQLEEFIENNQYIAARGVVRDGNGNIIHLEIRAGERISVPDNIAAAYEAGYTPSVGGTKNNVGNAQVMQDVSDMCLVPNSMDKYGNVFGAQDATLKCVDGVCPTNIYTATLNIDNIVKGSTKINKVPDVQNIQSKPTIEFFVRDVKYTGEQHGYTIFTYSDGRKIIVTGFPENMNMFTGNLKGVITEYTITNLKNELFPKKDWENNPSRKLIQKWGLDNDQELNSYLSHAKQAIDFVNTGNNGGRFDYDFCKTDKCGGSNSNTVQKLLFEKMNLKLHIPKDISLAGIKGKFYDGPFDNYFQKLGAELQKEQP